MSEKFHRNLLFMHLHTCCLGFTYTNYVTTQGANTNAVGFFSLYFIYPIYEQTECCKCTGKYIDSVTLSTISQMVNGISRIKMFNSCGIN